MDDAMDAAAAWSAFAADVAEFMFKYRAPDHDEPGLMARLIRETAVAAFVEGAMWGDRRPVLSDTEIMNRTQNTIRAFPNLYPVWAIMHGDE